MQVDAAHTPETLRARAQEVASAFPPLLAEARSLAATVLMGAHGRRRAGAGDSFWQYRPAQPGDSRRRIDWRQSARSDGHFVRETEWQTPQSVMLWVDDAASMRFSGAKNRPSKLRRAQTLGLALVILAQSAGERVGLMNLPSPPRADRAQLDRLAQALMEPGETEEYGAPKPQMLPFGSKAVMLSDFLGDMDAAQTALTSATDRGASGVLLQILDPLEESFPFDGRTIFRSMSGAIEFETRKAKSLREAYLDKLAERKDALRTLARRTGWQYHLHHTDAAPEPALLWLHQSLAGHT